MVIERLDKTQHERQSFSCGIQPLDDYLKKRANQDLKNWIAVPYVLCETQSIVIGYYTLSSISVDFGEFPEEVTRRLSRYPVVPATLIGRLAVDVRYRKQGLGEFLLLDALNRIFRQADKIAAAAVIVDAKDGEARTFYERYGFISFPERDDRLFLTMKAVKKLF